MNEHNYLGSTPAYSPALGWGAAKCRIHETHLDFCDRWRGDDFFVGEDDGHVFFLLAAALLLPFRSGVADVGLLQPTLWEP